MKIMCGDTVVCEITDIQRKILCNDVNSNTLEEDIQRRVSLAVTQKLAACFKRLKLEWEPKLAERGYEALPTNPEKFAALVFEQKDYADRVARDAADQEQRNANYAELVK